LPPGRRERRTRRGPSIAAGATAAILVALLVAVLGTAFALLTDSPADAALQLHVSGNKLVNGAGQAIVLRGVDRSGGEYSCVGGNGIWDGPMGPSAVAAMKGWHINAVRIPLNEACWNGESYVKPAYAGKNYRDAVRTYVQLLNSNGIVAVLDLHWSDGAYAGKSSACGTAEARCEKPMPDRAQAIPFWKSVAATFAGNDAVIFDLFNEPFPEAAGDGSESTAWQCWRDGGSACAGIHYPVAGMQTLVDAVRSTGANNVIMLSGLNFGNDLTQWLAYEPADPDHNLVASWHAYSFNACDAESCWQSEIAPVIGKVPVVAAEIGDSTCSGGYLDTLMSWLDARRTGYLAWAWNADFGCASGPGLITSYSGTPTAAGAAVRSHLAAEASRAG
jgi:endoglucanase